MTLKNKIEELIQANHLGRYIHKNCNYDRKDRKDRSRGHDLPLRGVINTISSGFSSGGSSMFVRKRHLCSIQFVNAMLNKSWWSTPSITFTYEYFHAIDPDQDDPMVITIEIIDFAMKTLFDKGNLVDIFYWKTFQRLGF